MRDMTADRLPRAGEHEGVFFAMRYSGHATWESSCAEVMNGNTEANPRRNFDWPVIAGHFGPPWFLPFLGAYVAGAE